MQTELITFNDGRWPSTANEQYRWYQVNRRDDLKIYIYLLFQVLYQVGVFISRSSTVLISIPTRILPLLPVLQVGLVTLVKNNDLINVQSLNAVLFFLEAYYRFMPVIYTIFALIFYEGLLGGAAYVNTFDHIRREVGDIALRLTHADHLQVAPAHAEYSMGIASVADTTGIVIAGFAALPAHNWICQQPIP